MSSLIIKTIQLIDEQNWSNFVSEHYNLTKVEIVEIKVKEV